LLKKNLILRIEYFFSFFKFWKNRGKKKSFYFLDIIKSNLKYFFLILNENNFLFLWIFLFLLTKNSYKFSLFNFKIDIFKLKRLWFFLFIFRFSHRNRVLDLTIIKSFFPRKRGIFNFNRIFIYIFSFFLRVFKIKLRYFLKIEKQINSFYWIPSYNYLSYSCRKRAKVKI
jgi:hypothetical protein